MISQATADKCDANLAEDGDERGVGYGADPRHSECLRNR